MKTSLFPLLAMAALADMPVRTSYLFTNRKGALQPQKPARSGDEKHPLPESIDRTRCDDERIAEAEAQREHRAAKRAANDEKARANNYS